MSAPTADLSAWISSVSGPRSTVVRSHPGSSSVLETTYLESLLRYSLMSCRRSAAASSRASDGESGEVDVSAGDVMWREAEEHSTENTGTTELRALFFELK